MFKTKENLICLGNILGKFLRGGVPDAITAARSLVNDWNTGKIKYCTQPPENNSNDVHISASIVSSDAREFEIDNFEEMETENLKHFTTKTDDVLDYKSCGPVEMIDDPDAMVTKTQIIGGDIADDVEMTDEPQTKRMKKDSKKDKIDPEMLLAGNLHRIFL